MTATALVLACAAAWLAFPTPSGPRGAPVQSSSATTGRRRLGWVWAGSAGFGAWAFVGGGLGPVVGVLVAALVWRILARSEDPVARRTREAAERDLPQLVLLLAAALAGGAPPSSALATVTAALPGAAADRLYGVRARLAMGEDPLEVWRSLAGDAVLAPLGRSMATALRTGAPVAESARRLAEDLRRDSLARREQQARTIGVRAALPLGLCLLPAFLLIGIVPVVAGLFGTLVG